MEVRMSGRELSLEGSGSDTDEYSPIEYLADNGDYEPTMVLERKDQDAIETSGLSRALEGLDDRSRRIVTARWLSEDETATLHDLAKEFGISAERVRQIEAAAMKKMRLSLQAA
jgi:RNA polymerase sigma-32 factor